MRWQQKARIQNAVSLLPSKASYAAYYWLQRHFGNLRRLDPTGRLRAGVEIANRLERQGRSVNGGVFLEIGTGHVPITPLAFWLMGAERTITVDINPYVQLDLLREGLAHMAAHPEETRALFGSRLIPQRFDAAMDMARSADLTLARFLDRAAIRYLAPADAGRTNLPSQSVDFEISYNVFEHVRPEDLKRIIAEGNRVVKRNGLFVHRIDYSDHFSHSDASISAVNFLRFSDGDWNRWAGNRYMYLNRLRHDDYLRMMRQSGRRIVDMQCTEDPRALALIASGELKVHERFQALSPQRLAIRDAWIVAAREH